MESTEQPRLRNAKPWSNIPIDIFSLIYDRMNFEGKILFSSVCKNWYRIHTHLNTYPWLMNCNSSILSCELRGHPIGRVYSLQNHELLAEFDFQFFDANVLASKRGWLLFENCITPTSFFCYNPFFPEIITLPYLDGGSNPRAAFSAAPISDDSVIFIVSCRKNNDDDNVVIIINLYSCGQTAWKDYSYVLSNDFTECSDVIYTQGKLYCVFNNGVVGSFSLKNHDWIISSSPSSSLSKLSQDFHMAECEGEIFMVSRYRESLHFDFFRLDDEKLEWGKVNDLANRAIFLNFGISSISVITRGRNSKFKNKLFYFLETPTYATWCFSLDSKTHKLSESYEPHFLSGLNRLWIDPPN